MEEIKLRYISLKMCWHPIFLQLNFELVINIILNCFVGTKKKKKRVIEVFVNSLT